MITEPTVLVLGAGASMPFGFPSGRGLVRQICAELESTKMPKFQLLMECGFQDYLIENFKTALSRSGQPSIDTFLEHRPSFGELGKKVIAAALLPSEKTEALFEKKREENWYEHLFGALSTSFEEFDQNKLSIVTFNYDRSIEYYLYTALRYAYGKTDKACGEKLSAIPIIHLHGKLGELPWDDCGSSVVPYDSMSDLKMRLVYVQRASEDIKIIFEDIANDEEFKQAHELLRSARRVYFLGFGFHPVNLKRLKIRSYKVEEKPPEMRGTSLGLSLQQKELVGKYRHIGISRLIELCDTKVYDFLYNHVVF